MSLRNSITTAVPTKKEEASMMIMFLMIPHLLRLQTLPSVTGIIIDVGVDVTRTPHLTAQVDHLSIAQELVIRLPTPRMK
jgi:hypothetical protein